MTMCWNVRLFGLFVDDNSDCARVERESSVASTAVGMDGAFERLKSRRRGGVRANVKRLASGCKRSERRESWSADLLRHKTFGCPSQE
jgi:hypothetical protein